MAMNPSSNTPLPASIIEVANARIQELFVPFRSADASPRLMQDTVHELTKEVVTAAKAADSSLTSATLIPVLRGGLPMFVAAQPLFDASSCVLVRCSKAKGSDAVITEWLGRQPLPRQPDDGRLVILDTIIATGDTTVKICDELWTMSREQRSVVIMCCYGAPVAMQRLANHPVVRSVVVALKADDCDAAGYLVPYTHGDIGDKLYGPKASHQVVPAVAEGQNTQEVLEGIQELLVQHGGAWALSADGIAIERHIVFKTFKTAWGFMEKIADQAATHRHHPEWSNVYNEVTIRWTTHQPRGLTQLDVELARLTDQEAAK